MEKLSISLPNEQLSISFPKLHHTELRITSDNQEVLELYKNHKHFHEGDAGIDLYTVEVKRVNEKQLLLDFGIQCEMLKGEFNISYMLVPRSSISKTPFRMSNSIGIIDASYRGNIMAYIDVLDGVSEPELNSRLFQLIIPTLEPIEKVVIVDKLSETSRGAGGFGSTGK